jgi:hypothetical protein
LTAEISLDEFTFSSSNPDCPLTETKLVELTSGGLYAEYSDNVYLSQGKLIVKTDQPFEKKQLYLLARSKATSSPYYLPVDLKVCGAETLNLAKEPMNITYSKLTKV